VTFDGPDLQPVVVPAEKLGQGWIEVLQYLRELREQVLAGPKLPKSTLRAACTGERLCQLAGLMAADSIEIGRAGAGLAFNFVWYRTHASKVKT
jgi:hypothetical protein